MELNAIEVVQNQTRLWLTFIPAAKLVNNDQIRVDVYSAQNNHQGYQRLPSAPRAKDYARYLKDGRGMSPNTVLINVRGDMGKFVRVSGAYGKLDIPATTTMWIVDGQHRIEGLKYLLENNPDFAEYPMPVVLMNAGREYEEAKQFIIINKTQKGVKPDLAERFISRMMRGEGAKSLANLPRATTLDIQWRPKATDIVDCLNEKCPEEAGVDFSANPWYKRIQLPNEPKGETLTSQKAFEDSLKGVLASPYFTPYSAQEVAIVLVRYWKAILSICKDAASNPRDHVIQRTTGINVFHAVLPLAIKLATKGGKKATEQSFREVLSMAGEGMTDEFWSNNGTAGILGTSHKSLSILITKLSSGMEEGNENILETPGARPFEL